MRKGSKNHDYLIKKGFAWLRDIMRCSVVLKEPRGLTMERPDLIGWKGGSSFLVECKYSRRDFLKEKDRAFRTVPGMGMGDYRYYLCEPGLIKEEDLPNKWGLLYLSNRKIHIVKGFDGFDDGARLVWEHQKDQLEELEVVLWALRAKN